MLALVVRCALAAVLLSAAIAKLARPRAAREGLATFGLPPWTLGVVVGVEAVLGVGVALGSPAAALLAAGLLSLFAAALAVALARGRAGAPCGCFGARSRVGRPAIVRNLFLAAGFAAVPWIPGTDFTVQAWLALGLGVALVGIAGLAVAVLALAREVGALRLALVPQGALEIPHEGPEIGSRTSLVDRFAVGRETRFALAVFTSDGCAICTSLEPSLALLRRDPLLALEVFDEHRDADAWRTLDVPGSPFAVALGLDGTVLAKGTFNNLAQLEGILATGERREREALRA